MSLWQTLLNTIQGDDEGGYSTIGYWNNFLGGAQDVIGDLSNLGKQTAVEMVKTGGNAPRATFNAMGGSGAPGNVMSDYAQRWGPLLPGGAPAGDFAEQMYDNPVPNTLDLFDVAGAAVAAPKLARRTFGRKPPATPELTPEQVVAQYLPGADSNNAVADFYREWDMATPFEEVDPASYARALTPQARGAEAEAWAHELLHNPVLEKELDQLVGSVEQPLRNAELTEVIEGRSRKAGPGENLAANMEDEFLQYLLNSADETVSAGPLGSPFLPYTFEDLADATVGPGRRELNTNAIIPMLGPEVLAELESLLGVE